METRETCNGKWWLWLVIKVINAQNIGCFTGNGCRVSMLCHRLYWVTNGKWKKNYMYIPIKYIP